MADYYSILSQALLAPESTSAKWRQRVYERSRKMLVGQLRAQRPLLPNSEIAAHRSALESAIAKIELKYSQPSRDGPVPRAGTGLDRHSESPAESLIALEGRDTTGRAIWFHPISWVILAIAVAAVAAGGYAVWATKERQAAPQASKDATAERSPAAAASRAASTSALSDGDLAPGVDGGSTDADLPYFFRRQPVFYRTTHPLGTIIIDKLQRFLYLIRPNNVALRYGIGIGASCADLAGLRRVTRKTEWPQWQPPQDTVERKLATPATLAGGPGNPLGARLLELDDGTSRIHGTNAPKTIGNLVTFGCIRLVNDDIVDLYGRVPTDTRVVVGN